MWDIQIHPLVLDEDFQLLDHSTQEKILQQIRKKLTIDPKAFGKPLKGEYKGYWRLAVSEYRVIYRIREKSVQVLVVKVGVRRDDRVYEEFWNRLKKL
jgi:mRNA interferase RelE/StbE